MYGNCFFNVPYVSRANGNLCLLGCSIYSCFIVKSRKLISDSSILRAEKMCLRSTSQHA